MFKLLITTTLITRWGNVACSCHTLVIEFATIREAEEAKAAINMPTADKNLTQEAVALYRTPGE